MLGFNFQWRYLIPFFISACVIQYLHTHDLQVLGIVGEFLPMQGYGILLILPCLLFWYSFGSFFNRNELEFIGHAFLFLLATPLLTPLLKLYMHTDLVPWGLFGILVAVVFLFHFLIEKQPVFQKIYASYAIIVLSAFSLTPLLYYWLGSNQNSAWESAWLVDTFMNYQSDVINMIMVVL